MKTIRVRARLRWGSIDREVAAFTATLADDQLEDLGAFVKLLQPAGLEVQCEHIADAPLVVDREGLM